MVAAFGFLEPVQVLLERLVALPRGAVDPLEHRALLVAPPVRARDLRQLERAELARRRDVRAAAQVDVRDAAVGVQVLVDADRAVAGDLARVVVVGRAGADVADDLLLERLVGEQLEPAVEVVLLAHERLVLGDDLAHARLDALEVRLGEVLAVGKLEVVVEAVGDRRTDRVLRAGEQVEDRLRHQVRGRVAQDLPALVRVRGDDRDRWRRDSIGRVRSTSAPSTVAATAALASPLPMDAATSPAVAPFASSFVEPSGSVIVTFPASLMTRGYRQVYRPLCISSARCSWRPGR